MKGEHLIGAGRVAKRFSRAALSYDAHASVQRVAAQHLIELIQSFLAPGNRALEIGSGSGQLTQLLVEAFPALSLEAIDIASGMVASARKSSQLSKVKFTTADIRKFRLSGSRDAEYFDLIFSNAALQWVRPIDQAFDSMAQLLSKTGRLYFSLMLHGTLGDLLQVRNEIAPKKARPALPTSAEVTEALARSGFRVQFSSIENLQTAYQSVDLLFKSLRAQGVTGGVVREQMLSRVELTALRQAFAARGLPVSAAYVVGFFVAERS